MTKVWNNQGGEARLTLGNLYVKGCPDQSHEGGVKVHCVVIGNWQVHTEQPLWRASQGQSVRKAVSEQTCFPEPSGGG